MLALPIATHYLWISSFKRTHDFFARIEHSFSNVVTLAKAFDAAHQLLILNYFKFWLLSTVKQGSLVMSILLAVSYCGIKKYKKDLRPEFEFFIIALSLFFNPLKWLILFSLWRFYLYFFTFFYIEAIRGVNRILRYLGSYYLVFSFISCAYIKLTYFSIEPQNSEKIQLYSCLASALALLLICTLVRKGVRTAYFNLETNSQQLKFIKQFIANDYHVEFNFSNRPSSHLSCYYINYKLAPYLKSSILNDCFNTPIIASQEAIKNPTNIVNNYNTDAIFKDHVVDHYVASYAGTLKWIT